MIMTQLVIVFFTRDPSNQVARVRLVRGVRPLYLTHHASCPRRLGSQSIDAPSLNRSHAESHLDRDGGAVAGLARIRWKDLTKWSQNRASEVDYLSSHVAMRVVTKSFHLFPILRACLMMWALLINSKERPHMDRYPGCSVFGCRGASPFDSTLPLWFGAEYVGLC